MKAVVKVKYVVTTGDSVLTSVTHFNLLLIKLNYVCMSICTYVDRNVGMP